MKFAGIITYLFRKDMHCYKTVEKGGVMGTSSH